MLKLEISYNRVIIYLEGFWVSFSQILFKKDFIKSMIYGVLVLNPKKKKKKFWHLSNILNRF